MYDRIMAMPRVSSAMRGRRIHSQGLRSSRIAEISVILLLTIGLAFAQVSPIHTVAATKPQPPTFVNLRDMGQGLQRPIQLLGGRKRCSDVQWWLCRGSLVYRSCGNHSQLQHALRANYNGHEGRL